LTKNFIYLYLLIEGFFDGELKNRKYEKLKKPYHLPIPVKEFTGEVFYILTVKQQRLIVSTIKGLLLEAVARALVGSNNRPDHKLTEL